MGDPVTGEGENLACIVLAGGGGERMCSGLPKVLHKAAGRTLLGHVLETAKASGADEICVVVPPDAPDIESCARAHCPDARIAIQPEPRGTGDAVRAAGRALRDFAGRVVILYGADPLVRPQTVQKLVGALDDQTRLAVLGFEADDPSGYGRLILRPDGAGIAHIREHKDATPAELAIRRCHSGIMAGDSFVLWEALDDVTSGNAAGEYYLTDCVGAAVGRGYEVGLVMAGQDEVLGVNSRAELAVVEAVLQDRLRAAALSGGAGLTAPETVCLSSDTVIGRDAVIEPYVVIGPGVRIGEGAVVRSFSHLEHCHLAANCVVGPFARLRPGVNLGEGVKIGNFVEIKNADIGDRTKVSHLSYIGDARLGPEVNIGAGVITCNYDGVNKHETVIGPQVFVGSNSALVAPLEIGAQAYIGAGSVITDDVPDGALALSRAERRDRPDWVRRRKTGGK